MKKSVGLAILMVFLLLYPRFAAEGARYGLLLWYTSVVPSLFPFMVLSSLIVSSGGVSLLMKPVRAFLGPWLPLSENGCYTLISGLLCGWTWIQRAFSSSPMTETWPTGSCHPKSMWTRYIMPAAAER